MALFENMEYVTDVLHVESQILLRAIKVYVACILEH